MSVSLKPVSEQVAVIVGASSGIGRSTALLFASKGAKLVVAAKSERGLSTLVDEIKKHGGDATFVVADVSLKTDTDLIARTAIDAYGRIDTWIHAAAILMHAKFEDTTEEDLRRILEVNVMGVANGLKSALPHIKKQGGAIIVVGSVEGKRALPLNSAYGASKHAVSGLIQALRVELLHERAPISITEVMPGTIHTPFFDKQRVKMGQGNIRYVGPKPWYHPNIVANSILYAATHQVRDLPSGTFAYFTWCLENWVPSLLDWMLKKTLDNDEMRQGEEKPPGDNFYKAMEADVDTVSGNFRGENVSQVSYYNVMREASPWIKWATGVAVASSSYALLSSFFW